jgi:hypothetical protein
MQTFIVEKKTPTILGGCNDPNIDVSKIQNAPAAAVVPIIAIELPGDVMHSEYRNVCIQF